MTDFNVKVEFDVATFDNSAREFMSKNFRPAIARKINAAAQLSVAVLHRATLDYFDRPTPFTADAFGFLPASPDHADPSAVVFVKPRQAEYLELEIFGGERQAGDYATVPDGVLIPSRDADLDEYGNLPRSFVSSEESDGAAWVTFEKDHDEHLIRHEPDGVIDFLAVVVPEADYAARFPFFDLVAAAIDQAFK